jgi:hypothetical protein
VFRSLRLRLAVLFQYPDGDLHKSAESRISSFDQLFAESTKTKPCWLTEWGIPNADQSCPLNDSGRKQAIASLRTVFKHFIGQKRLVAVIYYQWVGVPWGIFRCGGLTEAGKLALSPVR